MIDTLRTADRICRKKFASERSMLVYHNIIRPAKENCLEGNLFELPVLVAPFLVTLGLGLLLLAQTLAHLDLAVQ